MTTADQVKQLASQGLPASSIASEVGISRQRVYQIARKRNIQLPNYYHVTEVPRKATVPKARVRTGGIEQTISHTTAGTIADLLVAADLMARGWQVFYPLVRTTVHDLIATKGSVVMTVEVRSAYRNMAGKVSFRRKANCKSQYYALVITGEPVSYQPPLD